MKKIIILLILPFLLTSCYNYKELNNIYIVNSIGIKYENNKYITYLDIYLDNKESKIIKNEDSNLSISLNKAIASSPKELYFNHNNIVILDESLAKHSIKDTLDYLLRDIEIENSYLIITNDIDKLFENNKISTNIKNKLDTIYNKNKINTIDNTYKILLSNKQDISLPFIDSNTLEIDKIAYFNKDKLINTYNSKIYNFLLLNTNTLFNFNNNTLSTYKYNIKYKVSKDNITINIKGNTLLKQLNNLSLEDNNTYSKINKSTNEIIKKEIEDFLNITLKNNSDILGFKNMYYKKYSKSINNINYKIIIDFKLNKNGTINGGLNDE